MIEDGKVEMYDSVKKKVIDEQGCIDKFEVHPRDFINFQATDIKLLNIAKAPISCAGIIQLNINALKSQMLNNI